MSEKINIKILKIVNPNQLNNTEKEYRTEKETDFYPWAVGTDYYEIASEVIPDRELSDVNESMEKHPLFLFITNHKPSVGIKGLLHIASDFFNSEKVQKEIDILSMSATIVNNKLVLKTLVRTYTENIPDIKKLFELTHDDICEQEFVEEKTSGVLLVPDEIKNFNYSNEELALHEKELKAQKQIYERATEEKPFLNTIDHYVPEKLPMPEDTVPLVYDLKSKDALIQTVTPYEVFNQIYRELITYVSGVEYYHYVSAIDGKEPESTFMDYIEEYINRIYVTGSGTGANGLKLESEDVPIMLERLHKAFFELYVVQDLIDDPMVTDIKITGPDSIRARVRGKAYLSNIHFVDERDYLRFINGVAIRNKISLDVPKQTFTDIRDKDYILRFTITSGYLTSSRCPNLHIRKISRVKMMDDDLIKAGMFDEKIRDYLLDCGKNSRGVVFAGPPGSGKTVLLNWFLERAYEESAEILVIQENDELFTNRNGVMIEHVVMFPDRGKERVTLEQLGQMALVAGVNVFIIGEAKGAEICSAITLSNSGCRTAITIHSPSATETLDKMADLAMRGYAQDYIQAKRMLKSFQTIVYLQDFSVKEIVEITGFDEEKKDVTYRHIYRKEE